MARYPSIVIKATKTASDTPIIMDGVSVIGLHVPTALPAGATHLVFLGGHANDSSLADPLCSGGVRCSTPLIAGSFVDITEEAPEIFTCKYIWLQLSDAVFGIITPAADVTFTTTIKDMVGRVVAE